MPWTPMNTWSTWIVRRAATANGPTRASDGVRTPPVRMIVWSLRPAAMQDVRDRHGVGHDRQAGDVDEAPGEGVGGRAGGDADRGAGHDQGRRPRRRSPPSRAPGAPTSRRIRARTGRCRAGTWRRHGPSRSGLGCGAARGRGGPSCRRRRGRGRDRRRGRRRLRGRARGSGSGAGGQARQTRPPSSGRTEAPSSIRRRPFPRSAWSADCATISHKSTESHTKYAQKP